MEFVCSVARESKSVYIRWEHVAVRGVLFESVVGGTFGVLADDAFEVSAIRARTWGLVNGPYATKGGHVNGRARKRPLRDEGRACKREGM